VLKYGVVRNQTDINDIQAGIIRRLFLHETLRFSEINDTDVSSDQFSYHLRRLIKYNLVEKDQAGHYKLSVMGRSQAVLMDSQTNKFIDQGFVAVRVVLSKTEDGQTKYLVQKRTRVPYMGYIGEPGGKVLLGEDVPMAAKRNMLAETGLDCDITIRGLAHYRDTYKDELVQDKYFFVAQASNPKGTLKGVGLTGDNFWLTLDEIKTGPLHQGVPELLEIAEGTSFTYREDTFAVDEY